MDDGEFGEALQGAPGAAGGSLLDLDGRTSRSAWLFVQLTDRSVANRRIMSW